MHIGFWYTDFICVFAFTHFAHHVFKAFEDIELANASTERWRRFAIAVNINSHSPRR